MIWFLNLALAGVPIADDGAAVREILWARPFQLQSAHPYRYTAQSRPISEGWLLSLWVDPAYQVPRQHGVPVLWIGDQIAGRTNWGSECTVVWVPGAHDLRSERIFYGSAVLPERVNPARQQEESAEAARKGIQPIQKIGDLEPTVLVLEDFRGLMEVAAAQQAQCVSLGR